MIMQRLDAFVAHFAARRYWRWLGTPLLAPGLAAANPTGADVVAGDVAINESGNTLTLDQVTDTAAINWQSFSVGANEYVVFNQPSASSLALNRVVGGIPSEIFGHLLSNGRIFLINPSGVLFGQSATIDVGALVVSTANLSNEDFAAGRYVFTNAGTGSIVNAGNIIAGPNGFVVLAADSVSNTGLIQASLGQVVLASGNAFTLDLVGDGLINFTIDAAALSARSGVENLGQVIADGGKVVMAARTAAELARTVVNNQGLVQAHSIADGANGEIILTAAGGDIVNAGTLDASGVNGQAGGTVELVGDGAVKLASTSVIKAAGDAGAQGGSVHISGHSVAIRGVLDVGQGGRFALDPVDLVITDGSVPTGSGFIQEETIESLLQGGAEVIITATNSITLQDLGDNLLNGVDGTTGTDDGSLILGIGSDTNGPAPGGYVRGPGLPLPGGGIHFVGSNDAISVGRRLQLTAGYSFGSMDVGDLTAGGDLIVEADGAMVTGDLEAGGAMRIQGGSDITVNGNVTAVDSYAHIVAGRDLVVNGNVTGHISASSGAFLAAVDFDAGRDLTVNGNVTADSASFSGSQGSVTVGNVTANGTAAYITLAANHGITAGALTAGGPVFIATGNSGDVTVGNITAEQSVSIFVRNGNLDLDDITVTHSGDSSEALVSLTALGSTAGAGNILAGELTDTISVSHASHAARIDVDASNDVFINRLVMEGGGGSSSAFSPPGDMVRATLSAGSGSDDDLTIRSASLTTEQFLFNATDSSVDRFSSHADAYASLTAGGNVIIGAAGAGGTFDIAGYGDVTLHVSAGNDVKLYNVHVAGNPAVQSSNYFSSSSFASSSTTRRFGSFSYDYERRADARVYVSAGRDILVPAGGLLDVDVTGSADVNLSATRNVTIAGAIALDAQRASSYGFASDFSSSRSFSSAVVGNFRRLSSFDRAAAEADLDVQAGGVVSVAYGGTVNVAGSGEANLRLVSNNGGGVNVAGNVFVTAQTGHETFSSRSFSGAASSIELSHSRGDNSVGDADFSIETWSGGYGAGVVTLAATGQIAVTDFGGDLDVGSTGSGSTIAVDETANVDIVTHGSSGDIVLDGLIQVTGNAGDRSFDSATSGGNSSYGNFYAGGAQVNLEATGDANAHITIGATGAINVQAQGVAEFRATAWNGGVTVDGDITVLATTATFQQGRRDVFPSVSFASTSGGSYADAYAAISGFGGDVKIGSGAILDVEGAQYGTVNLYAGGPIFTPHRVIIDGTVNVTANGASSHRSHTTDSISNFWFNERYGSQGEAELYIDGDGVDVYGGINVTANGRAEVEIRSNGADIDIGAPITVVGNAAYFHSSSGHSNSFSYSYDRASGSQGAAALIIRGSGGAFGPGNVNLGPGTVLTVRDYGGDLGSPDALVDVFASGDLTVAGDITVEGNAGWRYDYGSNGNIFGVDGYNSSYADRGAARANLRANGSVWVTSAADIDVTGAGRADLDVRGSSVFFDGRATVTANRGYFRSTASFASGSSERHYETYSESMGRAYGALHAERNLVVGSDASISVTGAGLARGDLGANTFGSASYGLVVNGAVTVTSGRGSFSEHDETRIEASGDAFISILRDSFNEYGSSGEAEASFHAGSRDIVLNGPVTVNAEGDAAVFVQGRNVTVNGPITVTSQRGLYGQDEFSRTLGTGFCSYGTGYCSFIESSFSFRGDAFVGLSANGGALRVNDAITMTANGDAGVSLYASNPNSSAAIVVAAPISVTNGGGSGSSRQETFSDFSSGQRDVHSVRRSEWSQYGETAVDLRGEGSSGAVVVGAYGGIDIQAYGDAIVRLSSTRDVILDGAITVSAERGHVFNSVSYQSTTQFVSSYGDSHEAWSSDTFAGQGEVQFGSIGGNVQINAPITVSGHGEADVQTTSFIGGNVTINAPITVADAGSLYRYNSSFSSNFVPSSGTATGYHSFSSTGGASGAYAHVGSADVRFTNVAGEINVTANGGIDVTGVQDAQVVLATQAGAILIRGGVSVTATPGDYRYFSSSASTGTYYNSSYRYSSSNASGQAGLTLLAAGELQLYGGAAIDMTAAGSVDVLMRSGAGQAITLTGPVTMTATAGTYHSESSYRYDSASDGSTYHSDSQSDYTSASGRVEADIQASGNLVIGAGGITATAQGDAGISLLTGIGGGYGDVVLNGAIQVTSSGPATSSSHYRYDSSSTRGGSYAYNYSSSSDYFFSGGSAGLYIQATANGSYGGAVSGPGAIEVSGLGTASFQVNAPNGIDLDGVIDVSAAGAFSSSHYHSNSGGVSSSGQLGFDRTYNSFSSSNWGDASVRLDARRGGVRVGDAVTVSGVSSAQFQVEANYSSGTAGRSITVEGPVTVTATRGNYESSSSSRGSTFSLDSGERGDVLSSFGTNYSYGSAAGFGNAYLYNGQGGITVDAPVSVTAAGDARITLDGRGDIVISAPVSATATRAAFHEFSGSSSFTTSPGSGGVNVQSSHWGSLDSSSFGQASVDIRSRAGSVLVNDAVTVAGAGEAELRLTANNNNSYAGDVVIDAPISVTSTRGDFFHSYDSGTQTGFQPSGSGAFQASSQRSYFSSSSGSEGFAEADLIANNGDVKSTAAGTITLSGFRGAFLDVDTFGGNVELYGGVSVTAGAAARHSFSTGSSLTNGGNTYGSYGQQSDDLFGSAFVRIEARGSGDGNVTVAGINVTAAGDAQLSVNAYSDGAVTANGNLSVTGNAGTFDYTRQDFRTGSSGVSSSSRSSSANFGQGRMELQGTAVTVNGSVTVIAAGSASASASAGSGGVTVTGPITITGNRGWSFDRDRDEYTSLLGSVHSETTSSSYADVGFAALNVSAYNGGDVTLGAVTMTGAGSADSFGTLAFAISEIEIGGGVRGGVELDLYASSGEIGVGNLNLSATRGVTSDHYRNTFLNASSSGFTSVDDFTSAGRASADLYGYQGVTAAGVTVAAAGTARFEATASSGTVTITGPVSVAATPGQYTHAESSNYVGSGFSSAQQSDAADTSGNADFGAFGRSGVTLGGTLVVTGAGDAEARVRASSGAVALNGAVTVTATAGLSSGVSQRSVNGSAVSASIHDSSYGAAWFDGFGRTGITGTSVTVNAQGYALASFAASSGTGDIGSITVAAQDGLQNLVATGDATLVLTGDVGAYGGTETFGMHAGSVTLDGRDVLILANAAVDDFQANAVERINGFGGGSSYGYGGFGGLFAEAAGLSAGSSIDLTFLRLGLGNGTAPFGADDIADFLIDNAVPGLVGEINPNGALSAPNVTFGALNLTGTAIYVQTDNLGYNGIIEYNGGPLPPSGYVVRYDTYTPNAPISIVDAAGVTPGVVYFDGEDFNYPGTTYLIGGSQALNDVTVGDGVTLPPAGSGSDDNFIFMTGGTVEFVDEIPTSGQVVVINPFLASGPDDFLPYYVDWKMEEIGDEGEMEEDSLEHEEQPQVGEAPEGEEGQIDQKTGGALECK